jgi:hypothetical protein
MCFVPSTLRHTGYDLPDGRASGCESEVNFWAARQICRLAAPILAKMADAERQRGNTDRADILTEQAAVMQEGGR